MEKPSTATMTPGGGQNQYHQRRMPLQKKKVTTTTTGDEQPRPPFDEKSSRFVRFERDSDDINDRAEVFIKSFGRKLEMQRLDSII